MSKKKSTMTLKDFHGGSIPSDLPLPSAPGVIVRPSDRGGYDRQTSWVNPVGRSDHRLRPGSAGTARNLDDKTPFLSHNTQIGRNFDEDERKPLDGASGPRRTVCDESPRVLPSHAAEPKMDYSAGRVVARPASTPGSQYSSSVGSGSYAGRSTKVHNLGMSSQVFGRSSGIGLNFQSGPTGQVVSGPHPNAWGLRKEAANIKEPAPAPSPAPDTASKLAHASALEKVSSGRWHSRQQISPQTGDEGIRHQEMGNEFHFRDNDIHSKNAYSNQEVVWGMDHHDLTLAKQAEKSLTVADGIRGGGKEIPTYEMARPPTYMEANERNISGSSNGFQPPHPVGKSAGSELQSTMPLELSERPKLKLLPRSKPLENIEQSTDYNQGLQQPSPPFHAENQSEMHINDLQKGGFLGESGTAVMERPKLNLRPRSESFEQFEGDIEIKRNTLFGGARPRELVLKERAIDNAAVNNADLVQAPYRNIQDATKTERLTAYTAPPWYNDKPENVPFEHRAGKNPERRDQRFDVERADVQRNLRSENWRNKREFEKHHQLQQQHQHQQQQQERPPSPETWRKPVEHPKTSSPDIAGQRYGKAASAVELAQAFSRSISDPAVPDRFSSQRGVPGGGQMPFSRLMSPTSRPQINGY